MNIIDAWDDCFNFFNGKSPYHTKRHNKISHFTRNQRVLWKLVCALIVFLFSVFVPCVALPWEGYDSYGVEKNPPLLFLGSSSALFTVISLWVAAVHLYQPAFNGPRILLHYRRPAACSWEVLDWVFFEASTTAAFVSFVSFWFSMPKHNSEVTMLRVEGVVIQTIVVAVDFYFTAPQFKSNHVLLALLFPSLWLMVQFVWIVSGHQPSNELINFHTGTAPIYALGLLVGTIASFFLLKWYAWYLQKLSDKLGETMVEDVDASESDYLTPTSDGGGRTTQFELMDDFSGRRFTRNSSQNETKSEEDDEEDEDPRDTRLPILAR